MQQVRVCQSGQLHMPASTQQRLSSESEILADQFGNKNASKDRQQVVVTAVAKALHNAINTFPYFSATWASNASKEASCVASLLISAICSLWCRICRHTDTRIFAKYMFTIHDMGLVLKGSEGVDRRLLETNLQLRAA